MAKNKTINLVKSQVIYKDYSKDAERTALVSGENLAHMFGKIARWYTDISWVGHTHTEANITDFGTYAGASTKGGAATSANKLNIGASDIGSETKPVYFNATTGKPVACAYSLNASVPANAVFTDINVKQSPSTANESREVLFAGNTGNTETTGTVGKSNKLYFNPNTGALTATSFSGSVDASNLTGSIDAGRLPTTSVTAGSYGPAAGGTLAHGGTFDVGYVTVDKYGRLTAASTKTFTLPAQYVHPTYTSKTSGLYKITVDGTGHVSGTAAVTAADLPAHTHNYISSSGITSTTEVQINPTGASYNEGLRIGKASNGWSNINFGCSNSVTAGTQSGQWSVGVRGAVGATAGGIGDFIIEHNGASGNGLTLYADGSTPRWNNVEISMSGHTHPYLPESTVTGSPDLDTYLTSGVYHIKTQTSEHAPTTNHATLFVDGTVGTPYQLFIPDVSTGIWYSRYKSGSSAWSSWLSLKMTDTVYTHPTYTSKASGLYKITVDSTGHVSATATVAAADLPSHTHAYLPLAGGTMTGAITFQVADAIKYNAANATYTMISFLTGDGNGHGISIGGGGLTVLGSGESASALISALSLAASNETTYIASDNNIEFYSNCQTIGNRLGMVFDTSGRLRPNTNNTRTLGGSDYYWNRAYITQTIGGGGGMWIAARENAIIRQPNTSTGSAYFPIFSCKTKLGEWSIGTLSPDNELLFIAYTTDANYSSSTNTNKYYSLNYDGAFSGSAAKWSTARTLTIGSTGKSVDGSGNVSWSLAEIGAAATSHSHSNYLPQSTPTSTPDLNTYTTTGIYHIGLSSTNAPVTQHSTVYVEAGVGTPYQIFKPDNLDTTWYTRHKVTDGWSDWVALKLTDTIYTHPTYTSKTSGLYKITVDSTGHVSATAAVAAADLPSHTHSYLPLAGGTMTGTIAFEGVGSTEYPATSQGISFSGSTDGATIFYEVAASDKGCLVLQTTDDPDAKIVFRNKVTSGGTRANEVTITDGVIAGNGSGLTNLNASNISSGTIAAARLPDAYLPLTGGTMSGLIKGGRGYTHLALGVDSYTNDYAGLDKFNNVDINTWYGFSVSNACTTVGTLNQVVFSVNARTGNVYARTGIYVGSTKVSLEGHTHNYVPNTKAGVSAAITLLDVGDDTPVDNCYYITQTNDATNNTYYRRKHSVLWTYIKGKADSVYSAIGHTHSSITGPNKHDAAVPTSTVGAGVLTIFYNVDNASGNMPKSNNANAIIQLSKHSGEYDSQLGFSSDGNIYYRSASGSAFTTSSPWKQLAWKDDRLGANSDGSYWGMASPSNDSSVWIRTTSLGIIPYQSGAAGSGHQSIGTSSWYFSAAYIDTVHGNLDGTASLAIDVKTAVTTPSTNTSYGIIFVADPTISENNTLRKTNDFRLCYFRGAANTEGLTELVLGNNTAYTSANNSTGRIALYNKNGYYSFLYGSGQSSNGLGYFLPDSLNGNTILSGYYTATFAWDNANTHTTKPWKRILYTNTATKWDDRDCIFMISYAYGTDYECVIAKAHIRTNGTPVLDVYTLDILFETPNFDRSKLRIVYTNNSSSVTGEVWFKNDRAQYASWIVTILSSGYRAGNSQCPSWEVRSSNTHTGTGEGYASYTTGTGNKAPRYVGHTHMKYANGFWGMITPGGADDAWIRTTSNGIIPYQSGNAGSGHQSLGTSTWYFSDAYIDSVHGNLDGKSTYTDYLNIVATNEIRFNASTKPSSAMDLYIGYVWSDGNGDAKINSYIFQNGNRTLTKIQAASIYLGNTSGTQGSITLCSSNKQIFSIVASPDATAGGGITLPKTGGLMTDIVYKASSGTYGALGKVENTGCIASLTAEGISSHQSRASSTQSFGGTYTIGSTWYNMLSIRHRNGSGDGGSYGFYLRNSLTSSSSLVYNQQYNSSSWRGEATIVDSLNVSSYAVPNTADGLSTCINKLSTGTSTPSDNDYYVAQYAAGGTSVTSYHRRLHSALFSYINSKLYKILWSGSTSCTARSSTSITLTTAISANKYRFIKVVWNVSGATGVSEFRADTLNVINNVSSASGAATTNIIQFTISSDGKTLTVGPGTTTITVLQIAGVYPI